MWLVIRRGQLVERVVEVTGDEFVVGRAEDCDLRLVEHNVSRRHARLEARPDGEALLRDLGSANGTFVNGERVESATLSGGEQIQFGDAVVFASRTEPTGDAATVVGAPVRAAESGYSGVIQALLEGSGLRNALRSDSAIRRALESPRKARRYAIVASAAAVAGVVGLLFAVGVLPPDTRSVAQVVEDVAPSTTLIEVMDGTGARKSTGTGWVLDSTAGLVVTNAHVINQGERFRVAAQGRARPARVVGVAPCEDLALLRVADTRGLRSLALGSQSELRRGDPVVAVGYPGNASLKDDLTSTEGIVSVVRTSYRESAVDVPRYPNVIQTDAAINPGNSGGPLVDLDARLVGVNSAGRTLSGQGRIITGQGYAIGVDRVRDVLAGLRRGRSAAWTGIGFGYPSQKVLDEQALPPGLFIDHVVEGTPAAKAGLGREPLLIEEVNGRPVSNTLASYCEATTGLKSGDVVRLGVLHTADSRAETVTLRLP